MMASDSSLGDLVEQLDERASSGQRVSIGLIQEIAGTKAAGPMLLLPALVIVSPLSIIPGVPTLVGLNTVLVAGQIALGREKLWLPRWLTEREMPAKHGQKLLSFLRPISKVVDNVTKPRARFLTGKPMRRIGAAACVLVGLIMPILEVIPFTSTWAGVIVATYGLAITVRDGVLAMAWLGLVLTIISVASLLIF